MFKKGLIVLIPLGLISLLLFFFFSNTFPQSKKQGEIREQGNWKTYKNIVGMIVNDEYVMRVVKGVGGGIVLLPPGYKEGKKEVIVELESLRTGEKKVTLLKDLSEFTQIAFISDTKKGIIWLILNPSSFCLDDANVFQNEECKIQLLKYTIASGKLDLFKRFFAIESNNSGKNKYIKYAVPLVIDEGRNTLWLSLKNDIYGVSDKELKELWNDQLLKIDLSSGSVEYRDIYSRTIDTSPAYWSESLDTYEDRQVADVDKDGNLLVFVDKSIEHTDTILSIVPYKAGYSATFLPIFKFGVEKTFRDMELTIDQKKNIAYIVDDSWNGGSESHFYSLRIDRKKFDYIGVLPQGYGDDVRGMQVLGGKLLVGLTAGLGIYDSKDDSWKLVRKEHGLLDYQIRNIVLLKQDRLCVTHGQGGISCLADSFTNYDSIFN